MDYNFHWVVQHFFCWPHLKAGAGQSSDSALFCKMSTIVQLNVQVPTAENEGQSIHTLGNNIHCISKLLLFSLRFSLKEVFLNGRKIFFKILVMEFIFLQSCRLRTCIFSKNALLYVFSNDFTQICNLSIFFNILRTYISQNTFQ